MELATTDLPQNGSDPATRSQVSLPLTINSALPPELLLSVFDFIYTEMTQPLSYPHTRSEVVAMHKRHALLDVMLVCRAWRNLVVASARYWATVNVGIRESLGSSRGGTSIPENGNSQKKDLELQLERRGEQPIQVNVGMDQVEDFAVVFSSPRNQAHRWQVFNLLAVVGVGISEAINQRLFTSLFNLPLPRLTSLHVGQFCVGKDVSELYIGVGFQVDAPNLRALLRISSDHSSFAFPSQISIPQRRSPRRATPPYGRTEGRTRATL